MNRLGSFTITPQDSLDFAHASRDFNPLHLDAVAARRTRFGQTLIHGVCGTIKALDLLLEKMGTDAKLLSIRVKYSKPATQGQTLEVLEQTAQGVTRLEVFADGTRCQVIELEITDVPTSGHPKDDVFGACAASRETPVDLSIESCNGLSGEVELCWNETLMHGLFPSASRRLPAHQLAMLLASTRIVGMQCPGLHSVFAQLDLRFCAPGTEVAARVDGTLQYRVLSTDPRIDRIELALDSSSAQGSVEAFFRPPPVQQASITQIAALVGNGEFSAQNALVIGGSRGLGEVISKVLAAGGANLMLTYAAGQQDAEGVAAAIGRDLPAPGVCHYNVLEGLFPQEMTEFCATVTHIYYLASPTIAKSDAGRWDRQLFTRYCDFYIDGLSTLLQQVMLQRNADRELQLFIPSSIFLQQSVKGFDEYIAAKSAAEAFVKCFEKSHRNCTVVAPRLPRLYTDQTSNSKNSDEQQTLKVIIDELRLASGTARQLSR
jgi:acyl dehydratase/NAD(P)-dependent dehydrogenase (short-subunit alcohol dehydrogenase family)